LKTEHQLILCWTLGVPSRMNIGQIYETVLGWAGQTWVENLLLNFWWCFLDQINELTDEAGIPFGHTTWWMTFPSSSNCWCNLYVEIRTYGWW
jgi:DNA-directed RNA polymerase beta subunit